jgi:Cu/Ag efflux protein CusF
MKALRTTWVSGIIFLIILVFASCILAQEAAQQTPPGEAATPAELSTSVVSVEPTAPAEPVAPAASIEPAAPAAAPAEVAPAEWVWGEVVSVDTEKKQIVLKHLDYDTYEEVQTTLKVGDKTLFENVASLGEIKAGNHLTADFKIVEGSSLADLIVVEKDVQEESMVSEPVIEPETAVAPEAAAAAAPEAVEMSLPVLEAPAAPGNETAPIANVQ